ALPDAADVQPLLRRSRQAELGSRSLSHDHAREGQGRARQVPDARARDHGGHAAGREVVKNLALILLVACSSAPKPIDEPPQFEEKKPMPLPEPPHPPQPKIATQTAKPQDL